MVPLPVPLVHHMVPHPALQAPLTELPQLPQAPLMEPPLQPQAPPMVLLQPQPLMGLHPLLQLQPLTGLHPLLQLQPPMVLQLPQALLMAPHQQLQAPHTEPHHPLLLALAVPTACQISEMPGLTTLLSKVSNALA